MQREHGSLEILPQHSDAARTVRKVPLLFLLLQRERVFEAAQNIRLVCLVGVDLEAELADADPVEPLFDDVERRLLFGDEENALPVLDGVGDDVGDGLALARAGRAVQHEARPRARERHGGILRAVGGERDEGVLRVALVLRRHARLLPGKPFPHQRRDDLVFLQRVEVVADIVPHQIALEGEGGKIGILADVPALHGGDLGEHHREDLGDLQRRDVAAQTADVDVELLFEIFEESGIDEILPVRFDGKVLVSLRALHHDGNEHERGKARLVVLAGDKLQKAQCKIEDLGARLLVRFAVAPYEAQRRLRRRLGVGEGAQDPLSELERKEIGRERGLRLEERLLDGRAAL